MFSIPSKGRTFFIQTLTFHPQILLQSPKRIPNSVNLKLGLLVFLFVTTSSDSKAQGTEPFWAGISNKLAQVQRYRLQAAVRNSQLDTLGSLSVVYLEKDFQKHREQRFDLPFVQPNGASGNISVDEKTVIVRPLRAFGPDYIPSTNNLAPSYVVRSGQSESSLEQLIFQEAIVNFGNDLQPVGTNMGIVTFAATKEKTIFQVGVKASDNTVLWTEERNGDKESRTTYSDYRSSAEGLVPHFIETRNKSNQDFSVATYFIAFFESNQSTNYWLPSSIPKYTQVTDLRFQPELSYVQGAKQYTDQELAQFAFDRKRGKRPQMGLYAEESSVSVKPPRTSLLLIMILLLAFPVVVMWKRGNNAKVTNPE